MRSARAPVNDRYLHKNHIQIWFSTKKKQKNVLFEFDDEHV